MSSAEIIDFAEARDALAVTKAIRKSSEPIAAPVRADSFLKYAEDAFFAIYGHSPYDDE